MKDSFKEKNSVFERHPNTTIFIMVTISIVIFDVLLTNTYNYYKEREGEIRVSHPVYHHTFKKNSKSSEIKCGNKYTIFTNSLGFKDKSSREVPLASTNHRVLFIGDSFTEGVCLNYEDTFVGIIDATLSKKQIEVLNAGRSSYSPIIYWRKIEYLIEDVGLQFDEVVVFIDISDAQDEAVLYDLSDNMNVIKGSAIFDITDAQGETVVYDLSEDIKNLSGPEPHQPKDLKELVFQNTTVIYHTLNFLYDSFNLNKKQTGMEKRRKEMNSQWSRILSSNYSRDKWTLDKIFYNAYGNDGVILMEKYMDRLLKMVRDNGIDLTIAVYPWPSQVLYEDLNSIQVNIWKKWCQENKVKFINYFPDFVVIGLDRTEKLQLLEKYYFAGDMHFNKEGNQLLAHKFINSYLNEE